VYKLRREWVAFLCSTKQILLYIISRCVQTTVWFVCMRCVCSCSLVIWQKTLWLLAHSGAVAGILVNSQITMTSKPLGAHYGLWLNFVLIFTSYKAIAHSSAKGHSIGCVSFLLLILNIKRTISLQCLFYFSSYSEFAKALAWTFAKCLEDKGALLSSACTKLVVISHRRVWVDFVWSGLLYLLPWLLLMFFISCLQPHAFQSQGLTKIYCLVSCIHL